MTREFTLSALFAHASKTVVFGRRQWDGAAEQYSFILKEEKLFSTKRMKVMLVAAVAAMALTAVTAGAASASIVPAKFSTASEFYIKAPSGVTIKKNGESAKTCTMANVRVAPTGSEFWGANESAGGVKFNCSNFTALQTTLLGAAKYDTVTERYWLQVSDYTAHTLASPYGLYWQKSAGLDQWTWVNGSGATSSTITLNEVRIGYLESTGENITMSGTLTATTLSGGLITLTH